MEPSGNINSLIHIGVTKSEKIFSTRSSARKNPQHLLIDFVYRVKQAGALIGRFKHILTNSACGIVIYSRLKLVNIRLNQFRLVLNNNGRCVSNSGIRTGPLKVADGDDENDGEEMKRQTESEDRFKIHHKEKS